MTKRLDVSIGPVQGFVAQSRRTRDLWGSSYLLSFLAGHAMFGAAKAGGKVRPNADEDPLYRWIKGQREGNAPRIGSLPNRFVIETEKNPRDVANAAAGQLEAAWAHACEAVWKKYVEPAADAGNGTEEIWQRQIDAGSFWEVAWTAGAVEAGSRLLARRKHWRSHRPPDEPGDKCTVMHDYQEISGFERARGSGDGERQDGFWNQVRVRGRLGPLELRDNERLCAIAMVKRLFPKVACDALGWDIEMSRWPSTVYVGALPWIRKAASAVPCQAEEYADEVKRAVDEVLAERHPPFTGLNVPDAGDFPKLDANFFHRDFLRNEQLCPLPEVSRKRMEQMLKSICVANRGDGYAIGQPSAYYALLLADGDRLGRLVAKLRGSHVSESLAKFTSGVQEIVQQHDGVTVYAGGDDVLAMLAVPRALACAAALSECYRSSFGRHPGATLSAAVVFAHIRLPLAEVLSEAHRLLDDIAKDANRRDSLVAAVLKPGGLNCQWVTTWQRAHQFGGSSCAVALIDDLAGRLRVDAAEPGISSSLIYRIRASLAALLDWDEWRPGAWGDLPPETFDMRALLRAEIHHSLAKRTDGVVKDRANGLADLVWNAIGRSRATDNEGGKEIAEAGVDALLLARFLADPAQEDFRE